MLSARYVLVEGDGAGPHSPNGSASTGYRKNHTHVVSVNFPIAKENVLVIDQPAEYGGTFKNVNISRE